MTADGLVDRGVIAQLQQGDSRAILADALAQADVTIEIGQGGRDAFVPASNGRVEARLRAQPREGQQQEAVPTEPVYLEIAHPFNPYTIKVVLNNPYTFRAAAVSNVTGLLVAIGLFALGMSLIVAAGLARRFTTPLRRLTEATRGLAEGDFGRRVPMAQVHGGSSELSELGQAFNLMAERLEESVGIIRRDRDRSRDFLADVSHELRTPIAALRTFNELLKDRAGDDPQARAEFLESSGQQIDRLDWLSQNLLELSKLDSGLVLLDLRPDDLRAAVESAVEQAGAAADRRGVELVATVPEGPLRIHHDPQRIGQVVTNLVGNAIKFTPRGGRVEVTAGPSREGARIEVRDTGVGIDASELPRIFDRFYRGSRANEARGSGSGLGLAIVRSIVDMHRGTVAVESRLGAGSRFTVTLPRDPRLAQGSAIAAPLAPPIEAVAAPVEPGNVVDSSPADPPRLNPEASP
ncbi:MAG TPA: HAMP domain-containing sensor histidine kinase [Vitreimonas sp.]|nr:HAMP domain-containing sensor histidine kinase [Vitreimonas sp.]